MMSKRTDQSPVAEVSAMMLMLAACTPDIGRDSGNSMTGIPVASSSNFDESGDDEMMERFDAGAGGGGNAGDGGGGDCTSPAEANATVTGTVYAPNLEIPISGAVVYVTSGDAQPVPDEVYCSECVQVSCNEHYVLTNPDGTFEVPARAGAGQKLVVQKGQFLHAADIDIVEGHNQAAAADSSLPGEWNPAEGKWIPRIAVVEGYADSIFNILAKIGMGEVSGNGSLINGTENFELLSPWDGGALLDDLEAMRDYHIIFVPCGAEFEMGSVTPQRRENIRQWVAEGGKWYVTDWANEYLYESFPDYQHMHHQFGEADLDLYDTTGYVLDTGLMNWLEALPAPLKDIGGGHPNLLSLPTVGLKDNWSGIDAIPSIMVTDENGDQVDVGHHAWVEGPCESCDPSNEMRPMTISAEYGCGRMMFSTYHTNEMAHQGLTPQELILLYIILEISVCHDTPPPPVPPVG